MFALDDVGRGKKIAQGWPYENQLPGGLIGGAIVGAAALVVLFWWARSLRKKWVSSKAKGTPADKTETQHDETMKL